MRRPRCCVRRVPSPSPAVVVHEILQWRPHASILGEGCAVLACRRTGRADSLPPNSRRAAPPICPDLIFDRHRSFAGGVGSEFGDPPQGLPSRALFYGASQQRRGVVSITTWLWSTL